jgi:hypothetical protein
MATSDFKMPGSLNHGRIIGTQGNLSLANFGVPVPNYLLATNIQSCSLAVKISESHEVNGTQ